MPPFGETWFRVLKEPEHPVAQIRMAWILENEALDAEEEAEDKQTWTEYAAWFGHPERVQALQRARERQDHPELKTARPMPSSAPFRIVEDYSPYWEMYNAAQAGQPLDTSPDEVAAVEQIRSGNVPLTKVGDLGAKPFSPKPDPAMLAELAGMGIDIATVPGVIANRAKVEAEPEGLVDPSTIDWPDPDDARK